MRRRASIGLLLLWLSMPIGAQQADSLAGACMNSSDWFGLQEVVKSDSSQLSPFIRLFSTTMLDHFFHRPAAANLGILQLLRVYQPELKGNNVTSLVTMLAKNYSAMDDNKRAAEIMTFFINQIMGHADSATIDDFRNQENIYSGLAKYIVYQNKHPQDTYTLPFYLREVGDSAQSLIFIKGQLNGKRSDFTFDTGAGYNVVTLDMVNKYGLRIIGGSVQARGSRSLNGCYAIADKLQVGDLTLHNVPFVVLDREQGSGPSALAMRNFQLIIGQPLLMHFASWTLDFNRKSITLHTDTLTKTSIRSNLCLTSGGTMTVEAKSGDHRYALDLDCGATSSWMGPDYYRDHQDDVARYGRWSIKAGSGYGGVVYTSQFTLPSISLRISDRAVEMKNIPVITLSSEKSPIYEIAGRLGIDFFSKWRRVTVDHINMRLFLE